MQTLRVTRVYFNPIPAGNTVCSFWWLSASSPSPTLISSGISVPPNGILATPLDFNTPDENVTVRAVANCGGTPYEEVMPYTGTTTTTTTSGTTTTTTTAGGTTTTTTSGGTTTTTTGGTTTTTTANNADLDPAHYSADGVGGIQGTCGFNSTSCTRDSAATNASIVPNRRVQVTVRYSSDNAGGNTQDVIYIFEVGASSGLPPGGDSSVNLASGGACSIINATIISIVIV